MKSKIIMLGIFAMLLLGSGCVQQEEAELFIFDCVVTDSHTFTRDSFEQFTYYQYVGLTITGDYETFELMIKPEVKEVFPTEKCSITEIEGMFCSRASDMTCIPYFEPADVILLLSTTCTNEYGIDYCWEQDFNIMREYEHRGYHG